MDSRWQKIEEAVWLASDLPSAERSSWLAEFCAGDAGLKAQIESLLACRAEAENFLEDSPARRAAEILSAGREEFKGRRFGHYRIVGEIGSGGMGAVYLAERADGEFEQRVALKVVRRGFAEPELSRRFRRERQILASLNHENIARLLDGGVSEDGEPFLAMEYVEGTRIDDYCDSEELDVRARLLLFVKVCSAVAYAHQRLVIHRDLKPSNIIVTREGVPKLLDFGIAKLLDPERAGDETRTEYRAFTPDYASPEQLRGEPATTGSDVYSLGVLLRNLLHVGPRRQRATAERQSGEGGGRTRETNPPTRARGGAGKTRRGAAGAELRNIIAMATREEPDRRYPSVTEFAQDVQRYLDGLPVRALKDSFAYRASKFVRRNRVAVAASTLVVTALVVGLAVTLWQARDARRQRDAAQQERLKAERINTFLQRMLSFSNQSVSSVSPVAERGGVTVNEMLDQIAPQVETELSDQPDVRAQVLRTIGSAYASQGRYEAADRNLRAALDVQTRLYGEQSAEAAATMTELGVLSFRRSNYDEADRLLEKAVQFYRAERQANSPAYGAARLALALDYFGVVKFYLGDAKSARSLLAEALQTSSGANLRGGDRWVLTFNKSDLGGLLVYAGEVERGESLLREAEAEYRQMPGKPRWEFGSTLMLLGLAALNRNQPDEALKYLLESEGILREALGDRNIYLANNLSRQAAALYRKNDLVAAEAKAREAIAIAQAVYSEDNPYRVAPVWTLADALTKAGRGREGEECYRQVLAVYERQPKKNYDSIAKLRIGLSQSLLAQNRLPEAERVALEARDEARQQLGEDSPATRAAGDNLGKIYLKRGNLTPSKASK